MVDNVDYLNGEPVAVTSGWVVKGLLEASESLSVLPIHLCGICHQSTNQSGLMVCDECYGSR